MTQLTLNFQKDLEQTGETMTSLFPVDSHVNPLVPLEKDWEKKMNAIFGPKCSGSSEKSDQSMSWGKMFVDCLVGRTDWFSKRCMLIWKVRATKSNRLYYQLSASVLRTNEIDSTSLLPTPNARDEKNGGKITDGRIQRKLEQGYTIELNDLATMGMLPTPTTRDYKGARTKEKIEERKALGLATDEGTLPGYFALPGKTFQLNPPFVAEMMGFPPNWTVLPFLDGEEKV
jgi:hypothetical protein